MNSYDSISINIHDHYVENIDQHYLKTLQSIDFTTGEVQISKASSKKTSKILPIGFGQLTYNNGQYNISVSAKILKDNYLQGINLNTIEQMTEGLKPVIEISALNLVNYGEVYKIDATTNLAINNISTVKGCISTLHNSVKNAKYKADTFTDKYNNGIVLWGDHKTKHRLIAYDKYLEICQKKNETFRDSLSNLSSMLDQCKKFIRIESNFANKETIRKSVTGLKSTLLIDCLNSEYPINYNFLTQIVANGSRQLSIFEIMNNADEISKDLEIKGADLVLQDAFDLIITECKYNEKLIKQTIRDRYFPNVDTLSYHWARKKNNIQSRIHKLKTSNELSNLNNHSTVLKKILEGLKNQ